MLQIDHVYEFLYQELFKDFELWYLPNGVPKSINVNMSDISIFTQKENADRKILFYDQEPFIHQLSHPYIKLFSNSNDPRSKILVTSEYSNDLPDNFTILYYFFHGFAALDWYRGYYAINYNKSVVKPYTYDFISFNRIITDDRSYRIYFVSKLKELSLLDRGQVSFNVTDNLFDDWIDEVTDTNTKLSDSSKLHIKKHMADIDKLIIDSSKIYGSASASIPRTIDSWMNPNFNKPVDIDSFWHVVAETVFYYNKIHLTEKIFKPIVSKQPFMLLAAPGNLAYLKLYGFKTFDSIIDESYDLIQDNDLRTEAVVRQLHWYCNLTPDEKTDIIRQLEPIIDYNFHHFYGEFKHIITRELLDNTKALFQSIGYDDSHINYDNIYHVLTH